MEVEPYWSGVASIFVGAALTFCIAGCASSSVKPEEDSLPLIAFAELDRMLEEFPCNSPELIEADPYFYGEVHMYLCPNSTGDGFMVRAYGDEAMLSKDVGNWYDLTRPSQLAVYGGNWIAIGTEEEINDFSEIMFGGASLATDPPVEKQLTEVEDDMTICLSALTSIVEDSVLGVQNSSADPRSFEQLFIGISEEGDRLASEFVGDRVDAESFYQMLIAKNSEFKDYCGSVSGYSD